MSVERQAEPVVRDPRLEKIAEFITIHEDFPIHGVRFRNILPVLRHPELFSMLIDCAVEKIRNQFKDRIDVVFGLEARGFLFGPLIALKLQCGFAPIRKPGKLPGKVCCVEYKKEYGTDRFEIEEDSIKPGQNALIVDDVLATGGTIAAATQLITSKGANLLGSFVILELAYLNGRSKIAGHPCEYLYVFND